MSDDLTPSADSAATPPPAAAPAPAPAASPAAPADEHEHEVHTRLNPLGALFASLGILFAAVVLFGILKAMARTPPVKPFVETKAGVRVERVGPRQVTPRVAGYGRARPARRVTISAETGGRILRIHPELEDGHYLAGGASVVEIDSADAHASLLQAEANLASAQAEVARLEAQRGWIAQRLQLASETLELDLADLARAKDLKARGIDSDRALDTARSAVVRSRDAKLSVAQTQALLGPQLRAARARVAEAEARRLAAQNELARCRITLPFPGLIAQVAVEAHQRVAPGQALFELWEVERLEVPVALSLSDALLLSDRLGAAPKLGRVEVRYELPGAVRRWSGRVSRFEPLEAQTQTLRAVVEVEGRAEGAATAEGTLIPDAFCAVTLEGPPRELALALPVEALQEGGRVYLARAVEGVDRLAIVTVRTGRRVGGWVEVLAGLEPGDRVVTSPMERAIEGTPLVVEEAEPAEVSK